MGVTRLQALQLNGFAKAAGLGATLGLGARIN